MTAESRCLVCQQPVDQNQPHVRAGIIHLFEGGKMVEVKMWHLRCWEPSLPEYNPAEDAPVEYKA